MQGHGEELVAEIKKAGGDAVFVPLDVTKEDQWTSAMATWVARLGLSVLSLGSCRVVFRV